MSDMAILTDTTLCIGCGECIMACKKENEPEPERPRRWQIDDGLTSRNWTSVVSRNGGKYVRKQCRHCLEPACMSVCPVNAFSRTAEGAVVYDPKRCIGCRYCMMACPFGIPRYEWDSAVPYIKKCTLCSHRISRGKQPACTEACPTQATIFGPRHELLQIARKRLQENSHYIPRVWGESEVGGTHILYLSDVDLSFLHYGRPIGNKPLPALTETAMKAVPFAFIGMGSVMAGLHWIIARRNKLKKTRDPENENDG